MLFWTAFALGIFSSLHCVGMCGPIALATPVIHKNFGTQILSRILYNGGRAISYITIGTIAGAAGSLFYLSGVQQWISIGTGIVILLWIIYPKMNPENWQVMQRLKFVKYIRTKMGSLFRQKRYSSILGIGILNGLLPCGMVYMAVIGALTASNPLQGALYMLCFALGTWPLMFILTSTWELIGPNFRQRSRRMLPYLVGLVGIMLIVRGAGIGIPYLSPELKAEAHTITTCK